MHVCGHSFLDDVDDVDDNDDKLDDDDDDTYIHTLLARPHGAFQSQFYSQLPLRRTPLGPAISVYLREMSIL